MENAIVVIVEKIHSGGQSGEEGVTKDIDRGGVGRIKLGKAKSKKLILTKTKFIITIKLNYSPPSPSPLYKD